MQLSKLIGTMILSPDGEYLGYGKEAFLTRDAKALSCLVAVDGEEEEFILPARAIFAVGDAVIAGKARLPSPSGVLSPMGRAVFSEKGEYLGSVSDVCLSQETEIAVALDGAEKKFPLTRVAVGETVIVFSQERKKRASARKSAAGRPAAPAVSPVPAAPDAPAAGTGERLRFNRLDLLGRRVKKSVFDAYGIPVALAGERVTPEILSSARKRNRLLALTVNTLTNVP